MSLASTRARATARHHRATCVFAANTMRLLRGLFLLTVFAAVAVWADEEDDDDDTEIGGEGAKDASHGA